MPKGDAKRRKPAPKLEDVDEILKTTRSQPGKLAVAAPILLAGCAIACGARWLSANERNGPPATGGACHIDRASGWEVCDNHELETLHNPFPDGDGCNIPRYTLQQWRELSEGEVLNLTSPVMVSGITADWPAREHWARDALTRRYGGERVRCVEERLADVAGAPEAKLREGDNCTVREYVALMRDPAQRASAGRKYVFDRKPGMAHAMRPDVRMPPPFSSSREWQHYTFSLGGHATGVNMHNHPEAWNALVFGAKRWLLLPYDALHDWHERKRWIYGDGPKVNVEAFFRGRYAEPGVGALLRARGWDCVQRPGEMLWVPRLMLHTPINIGETLSVVSEREGHKLPQENRHLFVPNWREGGNIMDPRDPYFVGKRPGGARAALF